MYFRRTTDAPELIGRDAQIERLDQLLSRARACRGGGLLLTGESSLPFAGLGDLLRPLLPRLAGLPGCTGQCAAGWRSPTGHRHEPAVNDVYRASPSHRPHQPNER